MAEAEQRSVHLGLAEHRCEDAEPFDFPPYASNLLDPQTEAQELRLRDGRLLTDDHAPVDTMVFPDVEHALKGVRFRRIADLMVDARRSAAGWERSKTGETLDSMM